MKLISTPNQLSLSLLDEWFQEPLDLFGSLFNEFNQHIEKSHAAVAVEWFEDVNHYFARLDVPGISKESIELQFEDAEVRLSIKAEDQARVVRLQIPDGIVIERAEANLADGVLTLQLPKSPEKLPVTIAVE